MLFNECKNIEFDQNPAISEKNSSNKRFFSNFDFLREGDIDPALGKEINVLIENGGDFIVYLDTDYNIQYAVSPSYASFSTYYGHVLNKVSELEGLSVCSLMKTKQIREYRCMIGAAIARMYEHDSPEVIFEALHKAEYFLKSRVTETARIWYLSSASVFILILLFIYLLFYSFCPAYTLTNHFIFYTSILMGAGGGYLSIIMNSGRITVNLSSGRIIHFYESITRLLIGMIAGFFTCLVSYSGFINTGTGKPVNILIISFAAGFSERMVPGLINKIEISASSPCTHPKEIDKNGKRNS